MIQIAIVEDSPEASAQLEQALRTSKPDAARHGFGIRSIEFIVKQDGGTVQTQIQEDMFFLTIRFPR